MTDINTAAGTILYRAPRSKVYVAEALRESYFAEVPYLHCEMLHDCVAPEIGRAVLVYEYGTILREGTSAFTAYPKLNLTGKFVKIEIVDTVLDEEDEPAASITWYGVVEGDAKDVLGTRNNVPTGVQTFTVFGLLRLAERTPILESHVEDPADDEATINIKHALPFNQDTGGIFVRRGNRSVSEIDETYVFSPQQRSLSIWDAYEAVRYLLKRFAPLDRSDNTANYWEFHEDVEAGMLNWYDIAVECDGRSLKECLDALIDRKRGVGYYVAFNPENDKIELHVFTFVDADISLPNETTLKANPDQYSLNFENAIDIETAIVSTVATNQFTQVIARGQKRTTTFTACLDGSAWVNDWTTAEETEYLSGASGEAGYGSLAGNLQERANAMWRASDRLRNVFTRWKIDAEWDMVCPDILGEDTTQWLFAPVIPEDPEEEPTAALFGSSENAPVWKPGGRVLRGLPFLDRHDYSDTKIEDVSYGAGFTDEEQPDFIPPMAFLKTAIPDTDPAEHDYELLDLLSITSLASDEPRRWAASFRIPDTNCGVELRAHPHHMMASQEWEDGSPAATSQEHDPLLAAGCDWRDVFVTACIELDEHVQQIEDIGDEPAEFAPISSLIINVPDARYDWVVPYTVVEVKNGEAIQSISGGAIRDDRKRLASIARCAAEWYGRNRQTLDLTYKQVRGLFGLGWLITSVGSNYSLTDINTVITSITYVLDSQSSVPTTTVKTSFADLDVI